MRATFLTRRAFARVAALSVVAVAAAFSVSSVPSAVADEPNFQQVSDVVYKKVGDREIKLNLFLPLKDGEQLKNVPLLIFLDSGCWYSGDPGNGGYWRAWGGLERGCAIASVSHRPISEAPFPAPMEDVRAAVRFLRKNADKYGIDPNRFAVMGCSSGGHLSLTLGISDAKTPFNVGDNLDVSGQVQRVIDFYGPTDFGIVFDRYSSVSIDCIYTAFGTTRDDFAKQTPEERAAFDERAVLCSPITHIDADFAPTLILHGTDDVIVPASQSALLYDALRMAGVRSQFFTSNGGVHDVSTIATPQTLKREIFEFVEK